MSTRLASDFPHEPTTLAPYVLSDCLEDSKIAVLVNGGWLLGQAQERGRWRPETQTGEQMWLARLQPASQDSGPFGLSTF